VPLEDQSEIVMSEKAVQEEEGAAGHETTDLVALKAENIDLRERMLRAMAETENSRRRAERSAENTRQYVIADFARDLLAVMDNLQRAVDAASETSATKPGDASLLQGIRATQRMLSSVFERFGINRIEALGAPFDPMLHEAVMETNEPAHSPGSVANVIEEGYRIRDRLLRPARVSVVRFTPQCAKSSDAASKTK
jgi:molecular chaperone GrpE